MRFEIKNRKGQKIVVLVEGENNSAGLGFVMHGLGGFKEQPHVQTVAETLLANHYIAVRFDTTNTFGESDGNYEDATTTNHYEDLEDVISWAKTQPWFKSPFVLIGHSLGGISTALYAEHFPEEVKALAPLGTVVSGKLNLQSPLYRGNNILEQWKKTGWLEEPSKSRPGLIKRLKWSHMVDRQKYDLLPEAAKLTMPVLLVVGENDQPCPPEHQKILFEQLPGLKELHIIPGAPHTFKEEK